jgi:hypothetical protein
MNLRTRVIPFLVPILFLRGHDLGAAEPSTATTAPDLRALTKRLAVLEKEVHELESKRISSDLTDALEKMRYSVATFDPAEAGFQRIDTSFGMFAVSFEDVQPFADGIKVTISLGNPSSASFNGVVANLKYGPRQNMQIGDADSSAKYAAWSASLQSKEVTLNEILRPGKWNPVSVILPNIDPKNFGYLEVRLTTSTLSLQ